MPFGAFALALLLAAEAAPAAPASTIAMDRTFEALPSPDGKGGKRATLEVAAVKLGDWTLDVAGVPVDGRVLAALARTPADEPLERAARERLGRPLDLDDFLYFLDDVLVAGERGLRGRPVVLTPDRARRAGVFVHPDDVFKRRPRVYGKKAGELPVDPPEEQRAFVPPPDGSPLGPAWTARYPNPEAEAAQLVALEKVRPGADLHARVDLLVRQLRAQGAEVELGSTVRSRERGYLMYGAFWLSRVNGPAQLTARVRTLEKLNKRWRLEVPIEWNHPEGWRATREAARKMAEAYNVVYATRAGAERSHHYDGLAFDMTAVGLPRTLTLTSPEGTTRTFDLSAADQTRDLSLSPELIDWVEEHFGLEKLEGDYPHWDDARAKQ